MHMTGKHRLLIKPLQLIRGRLRVMPISNLPSHETVGVAERQALAPEVRSPKPPRRAFSLCPLGRGLVCGLRASRTGGLAGVGSDSVQVHRDGYLVEKTRGS